MPGGKRDDDRKVAIESTGQLYEPRFQALSLGTVGVVVARMDPDGREHGAAGPDRRLRLLGAVEVRAVFKAAVSVPEGFRESTWWADR